MQYPKYDMFIFMEEKKKGRPSLYDKSLGLTIKKSPRFPKRIWEILERDEIKKMLNAMAVNIDLENGIIKIISETPEDRWSDLVKHYLKSAQEKTPPD